MMRTIKKSVVVLLAVLMVTAAASAVSLQAGFLANDPQVFPFGDLISSEQVSNPESIDLSTFPDLFYIQIVTSRQEELDVPVYLHVRLVSDALPNTPLIDYYTSRSQPFTIRDWMEDPIGSGGYYTNSELGVLAESSNWLLTDGGETNYIDLDVFLEELVSGNSLSASVYTIELTLHQADTGAQLAYAETSVYIFSQSNPQLVYPMDDSEIAFSPVTFSWTFMGGNNPPSSWNLLLVEHDEYVADGASVIDEASPNQIIFNGPPTSSNNHTFIGGTGGEGTLRPGFWYYWQVSVDIPTMYPDQTMTSESNVNAFLYTGQTGGQGTQGQGGETGQLLSILGAYIDPSILDQYADELQGYQVGGIMINGNAGGTLQDVQSQMFAPGFNLIGIELQ